MLRYAGKYHPSPYWCIDKEHLVLSSATTILPALTTTIPPLLNRYLYHYINVLIQHHGKKRHFPLLKLRGNAWLEARYSCKGGNSCLLSLHIYIDDIYPISEGKQSRISKIVCSSSEMTSATFVIHVDQLWERVIIH